MFYCHDCKFSSGHGVTRVSFARGERAAELHREITGHTVKADASVFAEIRHLWRSLMRRLRPAPEGENEEA